jgi:hypothetical protein
MYIPAATATVSIDALPSSWVQTTAGVRPTAAINPAPMAPFTNFITLTTPASRKKSIMAGLRAQIGLFAPQ